VTSLVIFLQDLKPALRNKFHVSASDGQRTAYKIFVFCQCKIKSLHYEGLVLLYYCQWLCTWKYFVGETLCCLQSAVVIIITRMFINQIARLTLWEYNRNIALRSPQFDTTVTQFRPLTPSQSNTQRSILMNIKVFGDIVPYRLVNNYRRFGGVWCLLLWIKEVQEVIHYFYCFLHFRHRASNWTF
jgi:hypothetical protein